MLGEFPKPTWLALHLPHLLVGLVVADQVAPVVGNLRHQHALTLALAVPVRLVRLEETRQLPTAMLHLGGGAWHSML